MCIYWLNKNVMCSSELFTKGEMGRKLNESTALYKLKETYEEIEKHSVKIDVPGPAPFSSRRRKKRARPRDRCLFFLE